MLMLMSFACAQAMTAGTYEAAAKGFHGDVKIAVAKAPANNYYEPYHIKKEDVVRKRRKEKQTRKLEADRIFMIILHQKISMNRQIWRMIWIICLWKQDLL